MTSKNNRLNAGSGKNGLKTAGVITPGAYFRWLGVQPKSAQEIGRELRKQLKRGLYRNIQKAISQLDANQSRRLIGSDLKALKITSCGNFDEIIAKARLAARMPIQEKSYILDLGMDEAVPVALWRAEYHDSWVTSVSPYWQAGAHWAQEIGERRVTFTNNNPKGLFEGAKGPYDAVILSPGWEHYFDGILDKVYVPAQRDLLDPKETSVRLVQFFGLLAELVVSKGILILEHNSLPPHEVGLLANELDVCGVYPYWKLVMTLSPINGQDKHSALVFSRESLPAFVEQAFKTLTEEGQVTPGSAYFGESAQLFRQFFQDGELIAMWECEWVANKVQSKTEFLRKGVIGLLYKTSSAGGHMAQLMPEGQLSAVAEQFKNHLKEREAKGSIKIINKFPA